MSKLCRICGLEKDEDSYYFRKDSNSHRAECKLCTISGHRLRIFGLTDTAYQELKDRHNNCCAICHVERPKMAIDHCHKTGVVRGYLCPPCNTGIGMFQEDPERMLAAIEYVKKWKKI